MARSVPLVVAYVERRPAEGRHFSIERVFDAVAAASPPHLCIARVRMPLAGIRPLALLRNCLAARAVRADVLHVTGDVHYVLPFVSRGAVRVLTIHDLASLDRTRGVRRRMIRRVWFAWPLARADAVTTVSEETRRRLIDEFGSVAAKVRVIENPLTAPFADSPPKPSQALTTASCVVLAVGAGANKNLVRTAQAVHRLGASLRIIGKLDEATIVQLGHIGVSFKAVHSLTDDELLSEYVSADVLAFPSLHEGFGLPIVEAQAVGLPVVTSNRPPMSDVAAGGAVLVDPNHFVEIADAIAAICEEAELRQQLRLKGLENVRRYGAEQIANQFARLYDELLARDTRCPRR